MKRIIKSLLHCLLIYSVIGLFNYSIAYAQSCDPSCTNAIECRDKIAKCQEAWNQMEAAKKPHADALKKMEADILAFQNRIKTIEVDAVKKAKAIEEGEKELTVFLALTGARVREFYKKNISFNVLHTFLSSSNVGFALRVAAYQQAALNEDKKVITQTALSVKELEDKKKELEQEKASLAYLKEETDKRAVSIRKLVGEASAYQGKLSSFIASLTTKQQSFLAQKLSGLNLPSSLGAGPLYCTDDRKLDPGFSPAFAFFTFGIPHRVGMNQYGAHGRGQAGQNYEQILRAYFDNISIETVDTNTKIRVSGYGEMSIEDYMLGIYEMPNSFHIEALKAQAIAARSYALSYTNMGQKEICTTQACQVYKGGNKGGSWEQAAKETAGKVLKSGGTVVTAWYASTAGGYLFNNTDVWGGAQKPWTKRMRDTTGDVSSFEELRNKSYDKDSPCLYSAQGFRNEYAKSAWLKQEEVADIVNVVLLARSDSSTREHLYQPDKPNPSGTDTWDREKVKQELRSRNITPYNSINNVSASGVDWGSGITTQVTISGDAGTMGIEGGEFKNFFNLRAPANIQIVGPLFNIEKK